MRQPVPLPMIVEFNKGNDYVYRKSASKYVRRTLMNREHREHARCSVLPLSSLAASLTFATLSRCMCSLLHPLVQDKPN